MGGSSYGAQLLRKIFFFFLGKISLELWKFGQKKYIKVVAISSYATADCKQSFFLWLLT